MGASAGRRRASIVRRSCCGRASWPRCCASTIRWRGSGTIPRSWLDEAAALLGDEAPTDRGAERLLLQTRFLREAYRIFDARVSALDGLDERALHAALRRSTRPWCPPHVVVSVADHHADPQGLWPRRPASCSRRRPVSAAWTSWRHAESARACSRGCADSGRARPTVRVPRQRPAETRLEITSPDRRWIGCRDRDEEVLAYARRVKALQPADASVDRARVSPPAAVPVRRAVPARCGGHPVPVVGHAAAGGRAVGGRPRPADGRRALRLHAGRARDACCARPTCWCGARTARRCRPADVAAFDAWLARQRYLGSLDHLDHLRALPAAGAAARRHRRSHAATPTSGGRSGPPAPSPTPCGRGSRGSSRCRRWRRAPSTCVRCATRGAPASVCRTTMTRRRAARAARVRPLDLLLDQLEQALATHDATPGAGARHLHPRAPLDRGAHLRAASRRRRRAPGRCRRRAVRPLRSRRASSACSRANGRRRPHARSSTRRSCCERLGWPEERTRTGALRARFADLLTLPAVAVGVSVPELDQDAVVRPSSLLDELDGVRRRLAGRRCRPTSARSP